MFMIRLFYYLFITFLFHVPQISYTRDLPKVLSCVKGKSDDFDLHLVTLVEHVEVGTGEAYINDRTFNLVLEDGIWLGPVKKAQNF